MIKEAIGTGATLDEAKEAALKALEAPEDADIKYEVLERPQKKVLGLFGGSPAKVKACYEYEEVKADDFTAAKAYLNNILVNLGVNDAEIEIEADSEDVRNVGGDFKRLEVKGEIVQEKTLNKGLTIRIDNDER